MVSVKDTTLLHDQNDLNHVDKNWFLEHCNICVFLQVSGMEGDSCIINTLMALCLTSSPLCVMQNAQQTTHRKCTYMGNISKWKETSSPDGLFSECHVTCKRQIEVGRN